MDNERFIQLLTLKIVQELTEAEREELKELINKNPALRDRKDILDKFWKRKRISSVANVAMFEKLMARIEAEDNLPDVLTDPEADKLATPIKRFIKYWYSAAALLLLSLGIFAFYYTRHEFFETQEVAVKWFQRTTKPTIKAIIKLSDGTVVRLNSATTLRYPDSFAGKTREVYLDGEAYFDVHKDHLHPFIIHANKMNVRVLGTSFNVKSYKNEPVSETTLIRGSVEVTLNDRPSDRIILKPKEKLIVQNSITVKEEQTIKTRPSSQDSIGKGTNYSLTNLTYYPNNAKTIVETSWVQNKLVFTDKDFEELSIQMERWYGVQFIFKNDVIKAHRFSGIFERESLSEALDALKIVTPFKYKIVNKTIFIY
jgi:transmembrane sensor